ncbi:MAG: GAF domain-containing protein [Anaerolineaceae bacterium]|nr:GAF domain-containing protein [Anaerolineaceae bacterium]
MNKIQPILEELQRLWNWLTKPHDSILDIGDRRRAQLLSSLSLIVSISFIWALLSSPITQLAFIIFLGITLVAYLVSRTKFFRIGAYFFSFAFTSIAFINIYNGSANSIDTSITSIVPISLILASAILSQRGFLILAVSTIIATGMIRLYADPKYLDDPLFSFGRLIGIVFSINAILYGITLFRNSVERARLKEVQGVNRKLEILSGDLEKRRSELEQRVADRTRNLELAAEVGRSISQVRALDEMLKDACYLILKEFDLYYVQVYLIDPSGSNLKLETGTGSVGNQLVSRGHSLPLNTASINGRAAIEKRSVVISDTATNATFQPNSLLPETRSEMAVPLIVADKVVGALDMQSSQPGALTTDVLPAFEALAGQLAVAIQNANLFAEAEQARAEVEKQARRLVQQGWNEYLDAIHKPEQIGYIFDRNQIAPISDAEDTHSVEYAKAVSAPISVTGEPLGSLIVEVQDESQREQTSALINTVARQVAQQIENLRLLESAERYRYEAEQASRRLTREGWKAYAEKAQESLQYLYDLNEVRPVSGGKNIKTSATIPLKVRDEVVGKLAVQGLDKNDAEALNLANAVAERLSVHVESLRQYDATQSALAQSERLFESSRILTQSQDLQELTASSVKILDIPEINRAVLASFGYDSEDNIDSLDIIASWWDGTGHVVTPIGTHYSLDVIRVMPMFVSPTPVFFNDTFNDARVDAVTLQLAQRQNLRAVAVLPLFSGTRQIGALILEAEQPHNFSQEEARLFTALAPQIATILENRRQFERAQEQAKREATLNLINQKIQSATSVEAVLQIAARELGTALSAPMTVAQLSLKDTSSQ